MGEVGRRRYKGGLGRGVGNQNRGLWVITWAIVRNALIARQAWNGWGAWAGLSPRYMTLVLSMSPERPRAR